MLKWPQDHVQLKSQTAANPDFKPPKWLTYPQMLKSDLADFMVDETSPVGSIQRKKTKLNNRI